jgi:glycyl-tRNA synthetase
LSFARKKPPFGIAQVGKSFRNEITPATSSSARSSSSRWRWSSSSRPPEAERWHEHWLEERCRWDTDLGIRRITCACAARRRRAQHYLERHGGRRVPVPIGWSELEGIANRGNFDLTQHAEFSGEKLEYFDQASGERYVPHVIEPAAGATARRSPSSSTPTTRTRSAASRGPSSSSTRAWRP